jgi:dipeptidyl aminopeptidase/acylaminoacyl peptidase
LVHGANDTNVPAGESIQMFEALQRLGRRVECLIFDEEGHAIVKREPRRAGQDDRRMAYSGVHTMTSR